MSVIPVAGPETGSTPEATREPISLTLQVSRDRIIIGESVTFYRNSNRNGPRGHHGYRTGKYANGVALESVKPGVADDWSSTWNPGTKIQSGTYTLIVNDAGKTVSRRASFTVTGDGVVSVSPNGYAIVTGDRCISPAGVPRAPRRSGSCCPGPGGSGAGSISGTSRSRRTRPGACGIPPIFRSRRGSIQSMSSTSPRAPQVQHSSPSGSLHNSPSLFSPDGTKDRFKAFSRKRFLPEFVECPRLIVLISKVFLVFSRNPLAG